MRTVIDGRVIGYDDRGGDGTPLVLLHGFALDRTAWDPVVAALDGVRTITVDLRGCGESIRGDGPALMELLAGDVAALLDDLGIERAAIAGHSMGGYVAFAFFRMYAERVAGLALIASQVRADAPDVAAGRELLAARIEAEGTMSAAIAAARPYLVSPSTVRDRPDVLAAVIAMMERQDPIGAAALLRGMKLRVGSEDLLADIDVPTVVIAGADDRYLPASATREVADGIAGATAITLDGAGHAVPFEAPQATADALAQLVARITPPMR